MVFSRIRELVGHPGEVINKAHLYDRMMESGDPTSARQTLPILVKYSRMMKDLLAENHKVVPPSGTPRGCSIRDDPDHQPECCTKWSAKWRWCRIPQRELDPGCRADPPNPLVQAGPRKGIDPELRKGPVRPRCDGRASGPLDPEEVSPSLRGEHRTDPGPQ